MSFSHAILKILCGGYLFCQLLLVKCETCGKPVDFSQAVTYRSGPYGYREELFMLCKNKECLLPFVSTEEDKKDIENILTTS